MWDFFREFQRNRREVGAVAPSSRFLARALIRSVENSDSQRNILEVGPGTGAITQQLVKLLRPGDRLCLVEANPRFCEILRRKALVNWARYLEGVQFSVLSCYLEKLPADQKFSSIISGLPLNSFELEVVRSILARFARLLAPDGQLSYFEYFAIRKIRRGLADMRGSREGSEVDTLLSRFINRYQTGEELIIRNIPPAVARHFRHLDATEIGDL